MERKIGSKFIDQKSGVKLIVVNSIGCDGCFYSIKNGCKAPCFEECSSVFVSDGISRIFKRVKKDQTDSNLE